MSAETFVVVLIGIWVLMAICVCLWIWRTAERPENVEHPEVPAHAAVRVLPTDPEERAWEAAAVLRERWGKTPLGATIAPAPVPVPQPPPDGGAKPQPVAQLSERSTFFGVPAEPIYFDRSPPP